MNTLRPGLKLAMLVALTASMLGAGPHAVAANDEAPDSVAAFFKRLQAANTSFDEFRFLSGPEVQASPTWKAMAAQTLAASYSTLGRPNDALRVFPIRDRSPAPTDLPAPGAYTAMPAVEWVSRQAPSYRVVMVNEAHHQAQTRLLTLSLLAPLRAHGFTHLAVETLATPPLAKGYPTLGTGYYSREPVFAELIREAHRLGYVLVPYEPESTPDQTQQQRETGMARILAAVVESQPEAKLLVHAGYGHVGKQPASQPGGANPMAFEFMRLSALPVLVLDQAKLTWEAGAAHARLARAFDIDEPSVLLSTADARPWSVLPARFDASVVLPAEDATALRPGWLALGGRRLATKVDFAACLAHLPCLVEARHAGEGDDAIPADQFVMLDRAEAATPLYLAPGSYRLRLLGGDGSLLAERPLVVPSLPAAQTP